MSSPGATGIPRQYPAGAVVTPSACTSGGVMMSPMKYRGTPEANMPPTVLRPSTKLLLGVEGKRSAKAAAIGPGAPSVGVKSSALLDPLVWPIPRKLLAAVAGSVDWLLIWAVLAGGPEGVAAPPAAVYGT